MHLQGQTATCKGWSGPGLLHIFIKFANLFSSPVGAELRKTVKDNIETHLLRTNEPKEIEKKWHKFIQ